MDILSHGLWGAIMFGRRSRPSFWLAFVLGLGPDLLSFGILYLAVALGMAERPDFSHGTPPESSIPQYVHDLYNVTHSLISFLAVFFVVWALRKRPVWELGAWGLHVLVDVPTHSSSFFHSSLLAALQLEVRRLAMDEPRHPDSQLRVARLMLCLVGVPVCQGRE
jgi:hypothetical protein